MVILESSSTVESLSLRNIPKKLGMYLEMYELILNDTSEWKSTVKPRIINPIDFIQNQAALIDSLKKRWQKWKENKPNAINKIAECEKKIKRCEAYINLMAEILLEEDKPFSHQPDFREKKILEQTIPKQELLIPKEKVSFTSAWEKLVWAFDNENIEKMHNLFNEFLANPHDFTELREGESYLKGFPFHECPCTSYGRTTSGFRQKAETLIVEEITNRFENKNEPLSLASLGAGGLLQDLIIVGKLIQKGFKNFNVNFIDINPEDETSKAFADMLNKIPGLSIKTIYTSYVPFKGQYDFIYAIDFDDLNIHNGNGWSAVFRAKNMLTENGKFYLFGAGTQLILEKNDSFSNLHDLTETLVEELRNASPISHLNIVDKIKITATKDKNRLNFNLPRMAKVIQFLSTQFNKPIEVDLYGNEGAISAYRLENWPNQMVLRNLSGITSLNVNYQKGEFSQEHQKRALAVTQIFIREIQSGTTIEFGKF